jgi:hypothetical protein
MVGFMPRVMCVDRSVSEHGIGQDSAAGRQEFERQMESRRLEALDEEALKPLAFSWRRRKGSAEVFPRVREAPALIGPVW